MPARKRHRRPPEHPDPLVRFGRALKEREEREKAEQRRLQEERTEAKRLARLAAEHAEALRLARAELDRAIAAAKAARRSGTGIVEADEAWRVAKARVIELETGAPPSWAPDADVSDG